MPPPRKNSIHISRLHFLILPVQNRKFRISNPAGMHIPFSMSVLTIESLPPCKGRTLLIGDIHGCADELTRLLKQFQPKKKDRIIALGDLINGGPKSRKVLKLARKHGIIPILGNHEMRLLEARRTKRLGPLKRKDRLTYATLKKTDWEWMETWPHVIRIKSLNLIAVHGGFLPDKKWNKQSPRIVTTIQVIDKKGNPTKRARTSNGKPWASFWMGPEHVVYGHTPRKNPLIHQKATGIDTGCVYGNALTALSLPEFKFFKVRASRIYIDD